MNINFNGKIFPSDQAIFNSQNRVFLYGDALFETIRMSEGKIPFLKNHVNRLFMVYIFLNIKSLKNILLPFSKKKSKKLLKEMLEFELPFFDLREDYTHLRIIVLNF